MVFFVAIEETAIKVTINELNDKIVYSYIRMVLFLLVASWGGKLTYEQQNEIKKWIGIIMILVGIGGILLNIQLIVESSRLIQQIK